MEYSVRRRDPILQINIQSVQEKVNKVPVPSYMKITSWLESKPKGIGRGQFCAQSEGSFRVGKDENYAYRPTKKVYAIRPPHALEKQDGTKKLVSQTIRDPILNPDLPENPGKRIKNTAFCSSTHTEHYVNSSVSKKESYSKRNASSIFNQSEEKQGSQKRRSMERPSSTNDLLRYSYALPYREDKITPKVF